MRTYDERSVDRRPLDGRRVAILGYGAQGRAQALNLRDSGVEVVVGLRAASRRRGLARRDRIPCRDLRGAVTGADLVMMLVPDEVQGALWRDHVRPAMRPGAVLGFSHGFAVHFGDIRRGPGDAPFILVAPKGPGSLLRRRYVAGEGLPALAACEPASSRRGWHLALAYARAIGCARAGVLRTTFRDETVTDLFGEQAVLTGGMAELARAAFETLVAAGYPPEIAYIECVQEVRGLADILFERGIAGMRRVVSSPAAWGGLRSGKAIIDRGTRARMRRVLREVESGGTRRYLRGLTAARKRELASRESREPIERAGRRVRRSLRWGVEEAPAGRRGRGKTA